MQYCRKKVFATQFHGALPHSIIGEMYNNIATLGLEDTVSLLIFSAAPTGSYLRRISCGGLGSGAGLVDWVPRIAAATGGEM